MTKQKKQALKINKPQSKKPEIIFYLKPFFITFFIFEMLEFCQVQSLSVSLYIDKNIVQ